MKKYKELILYLIFGMLTVMVNLVSYYILTRVGEFQIYAANIISWFIAVLFAYITNKIFVFKSKELKMKFIFKEATSFFVARILTCIIELLIIYIGVNLMAQNDLFIKIISNIIVIIINYIFSKVVIFRYAKE